MISELFGILLSVLTSPTYVLLILIVVLAYRNTRVPPGFPPGPRGLPILGSIVAFARDPVGQISGLPKKYGDVCSMKLGKKRLVVLSSIEVVREALVKKQNDFAGRPWIFSIDLFTEGGQDIAFGGFTPKWKALRKIGHKAIRDYGTGPNLERLVREEAFPRLQRAIREKDGKPIDPRALLLLLVNNVVASVCFDQQYELDDPEFKRIMKLIDELTEVVGNGLLADVIPIFRKFETKSLLAVRKAADSWNGFIQSKIDDIKKRNEEGEAHNLINDFLKIQRESAAAGEEEADTLTDVNVRQLLGDIFGAGVDTTVHTLNWSVAYMVNCPDVQVKCQQEIDDVIGRDRLPLLSDKGTLPYCEAAIHEVMRIRTVVPVGVPRETTVDTSVGGYKIPKGTQVWSNLWHLHMDERVWKNPEEFRPERFLDENGRALPKPDSFLPFSAGRRVCLGEVFAKNKLFLIFVSLFQQFTFSPVPGKEKPSLKPNFDGGTSRCPPYEVIARERITG